MTNFFLRPDEGETLSLGPRQLIITTDPRISGTPFTMGTESLQPGSDTAEHRLLNHEKILFVHKGQGRMTVDGKPMTLTPGVVAFIPRQTWHRVRNTGTGVLKLAWIVSPGGMELYYRELAAMGPHPEESAQQELATRYMVEFRTPAPEDAQKPERPQRHRGWRRRKDGVPRPAAAAQAIPESPVVPQHETVAPPSSPPAAAEAVSAPAADDRPKIQAVGQQPGRPSRGRRRRRHGRPASGATAQPAAPASQTPPPQKEARQPAGGDNDRSKRQRHSYGRVKEVYMDGKWIKVSGGGPVISSGREDSVRSRAPRARDSDEPPSVPFSVPL